MNTVWRRCVVSVILAPLQMFWLIYWIINAQLTGTIFGISWLDNITNDEMKRAGIEKLSNIVRVRRLTSAGHILRLPPDRPASVAMQWVYITDGGRRRRGRPRKTWRQTFREDLQEMRVRCSGVRRVASDRSWWKSLVVQCSSRSGRI